MTDPDRQRRMCLRKMPYPDEPAARAAAKAMHKKYKAPFNYYACGFCGGWHIGRDRSIEAAKRRAEREEIKWHL